jgi:hypothetical protein
LQGFPEFPTTDGNYKLTSTVASGTATYAWEEDTGGSSGSGGSFSGDYNDLTNKPTLFSGDYNDLTNKPTIPSAYTLPTATTSTLGGVKVDGSSITINDGVISAVGGGSSSGSGATYTAGNGISIDENNVISNNMPAPTDLFLGSIYASLESSSEIIATIGANFAY